jgi:hypothetical protein
MSKNEQARGRSHWYTYSSSPAGPNHPKLSHVLCPPKEALSLHGTTICLLLSRATHLPVLTRPYRRMSRLESVDKPDLPKRD